jgi:hypothetical protein
MEAVKPNKKVEVEEEEDQEQEEQQQTEDENKALLVMGVPPEPLVVVEQPQVSAPINNSE